MPGFDSWTVRARGSSRSASEPTRPQARGGGDLAVAARPTPEPDHRADRHVEGTVAALEHRARPVEDVEQVGAHRDGRPPSPVAEAHQLALGLVIAEGRVEGSDPREC